MANWLCVQNCGACCHLDPKARPDLDLYLDSQQLQQYLSMVGKDGWCIHFDRSSRQCKIYAQRPIFCRVQPEIFQQMYGVAATEFDEFAIACCRQQITGVYGSKSAELKSYNHKINNS
jgi:Fe-S-cluster containining protein